MMKAAFAACFLFHKVVLCRENIEAICLNEFLYFSGN